MARRLTPRGWHDQRGFTLIELLVVVLIVAILVTIALPAFLSQRTRAQDVEAKAAVRTARTTLESFNTDRSTYDATPAALISIEPALADARNLSVIGTDTTFVISVDSKGANGGGTFSIELDGAGSVMRRCTNVGQGGCRGAPDSAGNLW